MDTRGNVRRAPGDEHGTPCSFPIGKLLYRVEHEGRKAVVETWRVTQHRARVHRADRRLFAKERLRRLPRDACLVRVDPPPALWKGKPISASVKRDKVPLDARVQDTEYGASISAAARKGLARAEAAQARWQGYLVDGDLSAEEIVEIQQDLSDLRYAIPAIKRLFRAERA